MPLSRDCSLRILRELLFEEHSDKLLSFYRVEQKKYAKFPKVGHLKPARNSQHK